MITTTAAAGTEADITAGTVTTGAAMAADSTAEVMVSADSRYPPAACTKS